MSRHDGVSCDACLKSNFRGRRYKCLICYDYDLCSGCYEGGSTTTDHTTDHPMQCILTRNHFEIFYGGEALTVDQPQSLTCPFCGKMGYTETSLQEHVTVDHPDTNYQVVCPICASVPGGDPNHVPDDFAAHLTLDHRSGAPRDPRDIDESSGSRHGAHRMSHRGRGLGRGATRRNMTFGSVSSGFFPSSTRESMDPIAELLSQLSGVRRATATDLSSSTTTNMSSHLHRQQGTTRQQQQLERIPRRGVSVTNNSNNSNNSNNVANTNGSSSSGTGLGCGSLSNGSTGQTGVVVSLSSNIPTLVSPHHPPPILVHSTRSHQAQSQFLLSRLGDNEGGEDNTTEGRDRASFVQELLLSTLADLNLLPTQSSTQGDGGGQVASSKAVSDAATQTAPPSISSPPNNPLNSTTAVMTQSLPLSQSKISSPATVLKSSKGNTKPVVGRSSPPGALGQQSNGGGIGVGRAVTGTGTVSVSPMGGPVGRGRASGGSSVSPGAGRRKMVRGVEGRTTQPPPPH